jgi:hypothetical protein
MSPTLFKIYIDTALSRKCKRGGLKIEDSCYVHNLLFVDDQVVVTRGVEDAKYIGRNWKKNTRNKFWKNGIFRYRSFREISNQWEYNPNCKAV